MHEFNNFPKEFRQQLDKMMPKNNEKSIEKNKINNNNATVLAKVGSKWSQNCCVTNAHRVFWYCFIWG